MQGELLWFYEMLVNSNVDPYVASVTTAIASLYGLYLIGRFVSYCLLGR